MAKTKYYAVQIGLTPGVYSTWAECEVQVKGVSGAIFKSFSNLEEAEAFVKGEKTVNIIQPSSSPVLNNNTPFAFVDGSFNPDTNTYGFGGFLSINGRKFILQGSSNGEAASMRNVAGEIEGALMAIKSAQAFHLPSLKIYYDYMGIEKWANGEWKANKKWTKEYAQAVAQARQTMDITFEHVKGHSGIEGNELADKLAKEAVGLETGIYEELMETDTYLE